MISVVMSYSQGPPRPLACPPVCVRHGTVAAALAARPPRDHSWAVVIVCVVLRGEHPALRRTMCGRGAEDPMDAAMATCGSNAEVLQHTSI